jgi:molybdopterin-guanine dinucleotide biosynthesis protein A
MRCEICLLAGGAGSRLGADKTRLRLGRRTLLGHSRATAKATGMPTRVIRADLAPGCGPLGGVYTALATTRAEILLFLPCDMPFVSTAFLKTLIRKPAPRGGALFVKAHGRVGFPFLLSRATLPIVRRQLASGQFALQQLARVLRAQIVPVPRGRADELFNINTPDDWKAARERWNRGRTLKIGN